MVLAWMTRWIIINKDSIPLFLYTLGWYERRVVFVVVFVVFDKSAQRSVFLSSFIFNSIANAILTLMNSMLLYRLLRADQSVLTSTLFGKKEIKAENLTPNALPNAAHGETTNSNEKQKDA